MGTTVSKSQDAGLAIGRWLGRREAFGAISGRCSAAEAVSLRRIRDDRMYRQIGETWDEFCTKHVGISKRTVDRIIHVLEEFGPVYFHVAQLAHVTPDEYRAIAAHVGEEGVRVDGAPIALLPENSEQVSAAVAELLQRERPRPAKAAPSTLETVFKRCDALGDSIRALDRLEEVDKMKVAGAILDLIQAAIGRGICLLR